MRLPLVNKLIKVKPSEVSIRTLRNIAISVAAVEVGGLMLVARGDTDKFVDGNRAVVAFADRNVIRRTSHGLERVACAFVKRSDPECIEHLFGKPKNGTVAKNPPNPTTTPVVVTTAPRAASPNAPTTAQVLTPTSRATASSPTARSLTTNVNRPRDIASSKAPVMNRRPDGTRVLDVSGQFPGDCRYPNLPPVAAGADWLTEIKMATGVDHATAEAEATRIGAMGGAITQQILQVGDDFFVKGCQG